MGRAQIFPARLTKGERNEENCSCKSFVRYSGAEHNANRFWQ
jgi:hypothetical protein